MTETGFYHPDRGYWQTVSQPSDDVLASYPEGTVEVPLKPGPWHAWNSTAWVDQGAPTPTPADVDAERARRTLAGHTVTVTGYGDIPLQGRPEDQINYLGLKDTASDLKAAGYTAPVIPFRDAANVVHMLSPDQMIEAVNKGKEHVSALYQAAWALKEMDPIPTDYSTNDSYWS